MSTGPPSPSPSAKPPPIPPTSPTSAQRPPPANVNIRLGADSYTWRVISSGTAESPDGTWSGSVTWGRNQGVTMPLPKPNPGDPLKANAITDNASYTGEANKPLPGPGITIRRTPAGSTVGLSAAKQLATNGSDSADGGSGGGDGIPMEPKSGAASSGTPHPTYLYLLNISFAGTRMANISRRLLMPLASLTPYQRSRATNTHGGYHHDRIRGTASRESPTI